MEGGSGRMQTSDKGVERLMDAFLKSKGFYRKKIAKDGSCLFRAVAEQVLRCQSRHTEVRATCVDYLKKNRTKYESFIEGNFEEYLHRLEDPQNWVGEVEISALALIYRHDFIIFQEPGKLPVNITENSFSDKVRLCFLNGNHYDSVYPIEFVNNAALCQSILYELLYDRVYGADPSVVSACLRNSSDAEGDGYSECKSSEESDLEEEEEFWPSDAVVPSDMSNQRSSNSNQPSKTAKPQQSPLPLSRRVQLSLNPALFRNVEYDVWLRSKRAQQKRDFCIAAGMQYTVGDKCKVRLSSTGRFYSAYIQEVKPDHGPVTVFIEELGEKHSTPLWNLRPSCSLDGDTWSTVAERGKRASVANGNGHHAGKTPRVPDLLAGRDGRGGGRRPGGKSSPTPQGPVVGPPPRLHKQHSWPPQAATEEPGTEGNGRASTRSPDWGRNGCMQTKPPSDSTLKSQKSSTARAPFRKGEAGPPGGPAQEPNFWLSKDERIALEEQQKSQALLEIMQRDERSFPALASQGGSRAPQPDAGRRTAPQPGERRAYRRKGDAPELFRDGDNALRSAQKEDSKLLTSAQPGCSSGAHSAPPPPHPEPCIAAAVTTTPAPAVSAPAPAVSAPAQAVSAPARPPAVSAPAPAVSAPAQAVSAPAPPPAVSAPPPAVSAPPPAVSAPAPAVSAPAPAVSAPLPAVFAPPPAVSAPAPAVSAPAQAISAPAPPPAVSAPAPAVSAPAQAVSAPARPPAVSAPAPPPAVSAPPPAVSAPAPPPAVSATAPAVFAPAPAVSAPAPPVYATSPAIFAPAPAVSALATAVSAPPPDVSTSAPPPTVSTSASPPTVYTSAPPPTVSTSAPPPTVSTSAPPPTVYAPPSGVSAPAAAVPTPAPPMAISAPTYTPSASGSTLSAAPPAHVPTTPSPSAAPFTPAVLPAAPLATANPPQSAPPAGFLPASLPEESAPYNGASPCTAGVMSQFGIAAGPPPPTPQGLPEHLCHPHAHSPSLPPHAHSPSLPPHAHSPSLPPHAHSPSLPPHAHSPSLPPHAPLPFHQVAQLFQDPLYPGFPSNDKDEMLSVPPYCYMHNGQDLPREISILRFFFNLGIKAYTNPSWPPHTYLYQLQQAHMSLQPKVSYMAPWYPEAPPPGSFRMNSAPMEGYGRRPSYGHATAGGRGPGQFEHAHYPAQPGVGVELGSDGRPYLGYSPQPPAPMPPHLGGVSWARQNPAFPRAFSTPPPSHAPQYLSTPPPPPAPQYIPPAAQYPPAATQYPPVSHGYPTSRLPAGMPGVPLATPAAVCQSPAEEKLAPPPSQMAPPPDVYAVEGGGEHSTPEQPGPPTACVRNQLRVVLPDQGPVYESRGEEGGVSVAGGGGGPQACGAAYFTSEVWEDEGEPGEEALQSGRSYYGRTYRGRRGYRDARWKGEGRGYRGRRGSDERRDYSYRDRRGAENSPGYPGPALKGQSGRGRGRGYNPYANGRDTGYTAANQRSNNYAES